MPATFELAAALARPGSHIANVGVHGKPASLHLEELWIKNQVNVDRFVTHHFHLDQFEEAYDVFARASETGALKVVLTSS